MNMIAHPAISRPLIVSFKNRAPQTTANTDSRLIIRAALAAEVYFCPTTCRVKAMLTSKIAT